MTALKLTPGRLKYLHELSILNDSDRAHGTQLVMLPYLQQHGLVEVKYATWSTRARLVTITDAGRAELARHLKAKEAKSADR